MFYNLNKLGLQPRIYMSISEDQLCFNMIQNELIHLKISAKLKTWKDEFGTYIEIECKDLGVADKKEVIELRKRHEKIIKEYTPSREQKYPQVDYIILKFIFSSNYKQKMWSWLQKRFTELSSLPKNVYELENYHKSPVSKISALHILDEALNERIVVN